MKQQIRRQMLQRRGQVCEQEKFLAGEKVFENLLKIPEFLVSKSCFCYVDFKNEIPTGKIREFFSKKELFVPKIDGIMYAVRQVSGTEKNIYGIDEPKEYEIVEKCPDISIIPLVACDKKGNRIGFGKGYYDRYLSGKKTLKICICYEFQVLESVPSGEQDITLDYIVTEKEIIKV
jgi:5-formyltetrahydrofolate cyclo-ligase